MTQPKHPRDCTHEELVELVTQLQCWLFVDKLENYVYEDGPKPTLGDDGLLHLQNAGDEIVASQHGEFWNPDLETDGADFIDFVFEKFDELGLLPTEEAPVNED